MAKRSRPPRAANRRPKRKVRVHSLLRHDDLPASVGLVKEVRAELVAKMGALEQNVLSAVHRTQTLVEEQRGENRIVLDALKTVIDRQDRAEEEAKYFRQTLTLLAQAKAAPAL